MKKRPDRAQNLAIEALKAAVDNPGPTRRMSEKRKFLLDNFETIQQARNRKPRPLSYLSIAKIITANGYKVSAQLVGAVCKEHETVRVKGGLHALDGAATKLDRKTTNTNGTATKLHGAAKKIGSPATKPTARSKNPK